jgi:hypothetical protein
VSATFIISRPISVFSLMQNEILYTNVCFACYLSANCTIVKDRQRATILTQENRVLCTSYYYCQGVKGALEFIIVQ